MMSKAVRVTENGQITIPKAFRDVLGSELLILETDSNNQVKLLPIKDAAGSLSQYRKDSDLTFNQIRQEAWQNSVKEHITKD